MRVTFKNDFHNTEASLNVHHPGILSKTQIRFAKLLLCGSVDCDCGGGILGERGPQHFGVVSHEQDEARIVEFDEPPRPAKSPGPLLEPVATSLPEVIPILQVLLPPEVHAWALSKSQVYWRNLVVRQFNRDNKQE